MLDKAIDWSVNNRLIVVLILIAILITGIFIVPTVNLDAFPDVTNVQVQINTEVPGLGAKEVEQLITYPIEAEMYALPDVKQVRSISKTGLSVITVVFKENINIYFARQLVFQQLQRARKEIPPGIGIPEIGPNTSGLGQIFQYVLVTSAAQQYDAYTLRSLNDWLVKLMLMPIAGVTDVLSFGGKVLQYQVQLNPQKLLSYHLTPEAVTKAIAANNRNVGGWYLQRGAEQLLIRGEGWLPSGKKGLQAIADIPIKVSNGTAVKVKDVAKVNYGTEIRQGATSLMMRDKKGQPYFVNDVVTGIVLKRLGANTKITIEDIKHYLHHIAKALPKNVRLVPIYDQANLINKAIDTVLMALLEAFILVLIILFLFLLNIRATLLVILSVPISVMMTLIIMAEQEMSANLMSLGGLAIAIGLLVDGSIVVLENIMKRLSQYDKVLEKFAIIPLIQKAAREVARPVFFAVFIIVIVFAPLFTLQGVEGKLFRPMAMTIVIAMLSSLVVALFVIPALASYIFGKGIQLRQNRLLNVLTKCYRSSLNRVLYFPKRVMLVAVGLFMVTMLLLPFLGTEFAPPLEEGSLNIRATLAPSANLETAMDVAKKLQQIIMRFPEVNYTSARVGRPELGGDPEPVSNIEILVGLKPFSEWKNTRDRFHLQQQMEKKLSIYPGLLLSFSQPIATRVDELLSGVRAQLAIKLFGPDLTQLANLGKQIEHVVKNVKGTHDVAMEQVVGEPQLVIKPDRSKLERYGISVNQIMSLISDAIGGERAGQIIHDNARYDIYVRLAKRYRNSIAAIKHLTLRAPNGAWVRLDDVAQIKIVSGPTQIRRDNVQRRVVIQANIENRDMGSVVSDIKKQLAAKIKLPSGYTIAYGGQFENQARAQQRLMVVVPIALILIFLLLYFSFKSATQALLIMVNVPLALIGGMVALYISGQYLSVPSSIGFIALFGIAVLNGVVLVNAINRNRQQGMNIEHAVFEGAVSRLRPVLMTAFTSALGLMPLLFAQGIGAEVQRPLATVVVGGLLSSTLLTLYILPTLYRFVCKRGQAAL